MSEGKSTYRRYDTYAIATYLALDDGVGEAMMK